MQLGGDKEIFDNRQRCGTRSDPVDRDGAFDSVATSVDGNAVALEPRPWIEYARSGDTLVDKHEHVVCVEDDQSDAEWEVPERRRVTVRPPFLRSVKQRTAACCSRGQRGSRRRR